MSQNGPSSLKKMTAKKALEERVEEEILSMVLAEIQEQL